MADGTLGTRIKRARERLRWSQRQLGDAIGVTQKTIDNWEHDKRRPKSSIGALEHVLGVRLDGAEPEPELPQIVRDNQHDPRVMEIWNMTTLQRATKLSMIASLFEREGTLPVTPARPAAP